MERFFIALILAALGFVTGALFLWLMQFPFPIEIGGNIYLLVGAVMALVCFGFGYANSDKTVDMLGDLWQVTIKLSTGILSVIWNLRRLGR